MFVLEQYSSNKFSVNECRPKIFPRQKKANYGISFVVMLIQCHYYIVCQVFLIIMIYGQLCNTLYIVLIPCRKPT